MLVILIGLLCLENKMEQVTDGYQEQLLFKFTVMCYVIQIRECNVMGFTMGEKSLPRQIYC